MHFTREDISSTQTVRMPPKKFYNCNKIKFECEKEQKFREAQVWAAQGHKLHQRFKWSSVNCSMAIFGLLDYACLKVYFMHLNIITLMWFVKEFICCCCWNEGSNEWIKYEMVLLMFRNAKRIKCFCGALFEHFANNHVLNHVVFMYMHLCPS